MASQIIQYGYHNQNMKETFSKCFEDLLVQGEELVVNDIVGGEPIMRKANPLNMFTIRSGNTYRIEDTDLIDSLYDAGYKDAIVNGKTWSLSNCEFRNV